MANTLKLGAGNWATKESSLLAYNDENGNFKPLPFDFTRDSGATRVNKQGLIEVVSNNEPRIDFNDNSKGALLLEPTRTNLITYSEDFSQTAWNFKSNINIQSGMLSPKGDLNAYKITATSTGNGYIGGFLNQSTGKYKSIWARTVSGTGKVNLLNVRTEGSTNGLFNLSEEWTRFEILHNGVDIFYGVDFRNSLSTLNEIIIYGAQLEQGSYATSYIPTQGGAVTRVAETCSQTPPSGIIGQTEGSVYVELNMNNIGTNFIFSIDDGGASDFIILDTNSVGELDLQVRQSSGSITTIISGSDLIEGSNKIAIRYKNGDYSLYLNGVLQGTSASTLFPSGTISRVSVGGNSSYGYLSNSVNYFKLYDTALSNAELQALTS